MSNQVPVRHLIALRPYQDAAVEAALAGSRALLALPTGTGKTVIASEIIRRLGSGLFVAHRRELLEQARHTFATMGAPGEAMSVPALHERRRSAMHPPRVLVIDEAHHATARTYREIIDWARPEHLIGITATPYRLDEQEEGKWRLGDIFGPQPAYTYPLMDAVRDGWLVPIRQWGVETTATLAGARISHGDIASTGLLGLDTPERNALVVDSYQRLCKGRRAIAFAVGVTHAQHLTEAFNAASVRSEAVYGDMAPDDRDAVITRYRAGEIDVLCSCQILTEGFDDPETSALLMARPTVSRGLYVQMAGRGLRLAPGKADCVIVDFLDVGSPHSLATLTATTLACTVPGVAPSDAQGRDVLRVAEEAMQAHLEALEDDRQRTVARLAVAPLEWVARDRTPRWSAEILSLAGYAPQAKWEGRSATAKQLKTIRSWGFAPGREIRRGEASALIDQLLTLEAEHPEPATAKQKGFLGWKGMWQDGMSKRDATKMIARYHMGAKSPMAAKRPMARASEGEWKW